MPRTLSGLNTGEFDSIEIFHNLTVGGVSGQPGTVLTSDGSNINWTPITLDANSVDSHQIKDGAVTHTKIAAGAVRVTHLAGNAVTTAKINIGAVTTEKIAGNAVTTEKIANLNVTTEKLRGMP